MTPENAVELPKYIIWLLSSVIVSSMLNTATSAFLLEVSSSTYFAKDTPAHTQTTISPAANNVGKAHFVFIMRRKNLFIASVFKSFLLA
jgi:hypothetical protein